MSNARTFAQAPEILERLLSHPRGNTLPHCHDCGACLSRCHLVEAVPEMNPRKFVHLLRHGWVEDALASPFLWACTLCNRCTADCPMDVLMEEVVRSGRGLATARGSAPEPLVAGIASRLETGNVSEVPPEEVVEVAEWLEEELQMELRDTSIKFPLDQAGSRHLYLPNPRELTSNPAELSANGKILHLLGEPWTLSQDCSDVTNWGYFTGDDDAARQIALQVVTVAERLGIESLVITECGHGYKSYLLDLERWIGRPPPFRVTCITALAAAGLEDGRLKADPTKNPGVHTYHDPCNFSRKTDLAGPPRTILSRAVETFVEMTPNRQHTWCCTGGGGSDYAPATAAIREQAGAIKMAQIRATNAQVVTTGCLSCHSSLTTLAKKHQVKVDVKTLGQILGPALVTT